MKTWCHKYGEPEKRLHIEHDNEECPACKFAGGIPDGAVLFVVIEGEKEKIRRVEGLGRGPGLWLTEYGLSFTTEDKFLVGCKTVSTAEATAEIVEYLAEGGKLG